MIDVAWKPIPGFDAYEVSNQGQVRRRDGGGTVKSFLNHRGYLRIGLRQSGRKTRHQLHRLVLLAFVGEPRPGDHAAHRNGVRTDNRVGNLRWATINEHDADKDIHGTRLKGDKHPSCRISDADIERMKADRVSGRLHRELALEYGVSKQHVGKILRGISRSK
jgi:hypothetical protein